MAKLQSLIGNDRANDLTGFSDPQMGEKAPIKPIDLKSCQFPARRSRILSRRIALNSCILQWSGFSCPTKSGMELHLCSDLWHGCCYNQQADQSAFKELPLCLK
jgi:hypothetical protein